MHRKRHLEAALAAYAPIAFVAGVVGPPTLAYIRAAVAVVFLFAGGPIGSTVDLWTSLGLTVFGLSSRETILLHILSEALTPMGVEPFGDNGPYYSTGIVKATNLIVNHLPLALGVVAVFFAFLVANAVRTILG